MTPVTQADLARLEAETRVMILTKMLELFRLAEFAYAADWGIAYDLQRAEQLIEREIRNCAERATEEEDGGGSLRIAAIKGERHE